MNIIGADLLHELVPMSEAIGAVRSAFAATAADSIDQPERIVSRDRGALAMLARARQTNDTVFKIVTVNAGNAALGLPRIHAVVVSFDGRTGLPIALIEGSALTALRTGAASGVATELLASPDARVLAMIGAGAQAKAQIDAICAVRQITEIRIASRTGRSAHSLAERLAPLRPGMKITAHTSTINAVENADVICCATDSTRPLFSRRDIRERVHINAVGAYTATMCELGSDLLEHADLLVVDKAAAALTEAGDLIQAINVEAISEAHLVELGTLLTHPGRVQRGGLTIFKSVGIAAQDWAIAQLVREKAADNRSLPSIALNADVSPIPA